MLALDVQQSAVNGVAGCPRAAHCDWRCCSGAIHLPVWQAGWQTVDGNRWWDVSTCSYLSCVAPVPRTWNWPRDAAQPRCSRAEMELYFAWRELRRL